MRWIFKNNEHYKTSSIQKKKETFLDWDFFQKIFRWEDGGIMILPLEKALEENIVDPLDITRYLCDSIHQNFMELCIIGEEIFATIGEEIFCRNRR